MASEVTEVEVTQETPAPAAAQPAVSKGNTTLTGTPPVGEVGTPKEAAVTAGAWRLALAPELQSDKTLAAIKGESWDEVGPELAKMVVNTQKLVGQRLQAPGPDAKPEDVAKWRETMGVPKDPSGYKPPEAPEGKAWDPQMLAFAQGHFHQIGVTPQQATALFQAFSEYEQRSLEFKDREYQAGADKLKAEWGEPKFNRAITLASRLLRTHDQAGKVGAVLEDTRLGNHPELLAFFATVAEEFAEDRLIDGTIAGVPGKAEAEAEIARIVADPKHPAMDPDSPQHTVAHERYLQLRKLVHGTGPIRR